MHSFGGVKFNKEAILGISKVLKLCGLFVLIADGGNGVASPEIGGFRRGKSRGGRWKLRRDEERE